MADRVAWLARVDGARTLRRHSSVEAWSIYDGYQTSEQEAPTGTTLLHKGHFQTASLDSHAILSQWPSLTDIHRRSINNTVATATEEICSSETVPPVQSAAMCRSTRKRHRYLDQTIHSTVRLNGLMRPLESLTDLDAAIEEIDKHPEGQFERAAHVIESLLLATGLAEPLTGMDIRVAGLLRIAAVGGDVLYNSPRRRETIELIRNRLTEISPSILEHYNIDRRTQADEACQHLANMFPDAMDKLKEATGSYDGLDSLERFRNKLFQALNKDLGRVTIRPFLKFGNGTTDMLERCLGAAVVYSESDASDAATALDDAVGLASSFHEHLDNVPTAVSREVGKVIQQLGTDLRSHFDASPFSRPAKLLIDTKLRRYPLYEPNLELSIPVEVRNDGQGVAIDVVLELSGAIGVDPIGPPHRLYNVAPGSMVVECQAQTNPQEMEEEGIEAALCEFRLTWVNADGSEVEANQIGELASQDSEIDWDNLRISDPYSLEAVTTQEELIGRESMLGRITRVLTNRSVDSLYIHGQKRVGKTSLAHVALQLVKERAHAVCIYLDIGDIYNPDPSRTIDNLTAELISALADHFPLPIDARDFESDGSLVPLSKVLKEIAAPDNPIVIALDEFDQLPSSMFRRTAEQEAFFTTLRSMSRIRGVGIVLIGGEQMKIITSGPPSVKLNKFTPFQVDYLDRSTHWPEFEELVRKPTDKYLEFTDEACFAIYKLTSGNPYYSKLLCGQILDSAIQRRDAYIDVREVSAATEMLLSTLEANSFSHYWEDFLHEEDDKRDEEALNRKRCLLALGLTWSSGALATTDAIAAEAIQNDLAFTSLQRELSEFANRGILVDRDGGWAPRVELFGRWVKERGQEQIVISAAELASVKNVVAERESMRISLHDAQELSLQFGIYKGKAISEERILQYLSQFGGIREQRLVFQFLKKVKFVDQIDEYSLLKEAYGKLELRLKHRHGRWEKGQIALSYTGSRGKSSLAMARAFIDANITKFRRGEFHGRDELQSLIKRNGVTDVIIVDDFVGTGATLTHDLEELALKLPSSTFVQILILAGMQDGLDAVSQACQKLFGDSFFVDCLHKIPNDPGPFDVEAGIYGDPEDATDARKIFEEVGKKLEPKAAMGYGNCCAPIVFSRTIPNNAPAVLWSAASGSFGFVPLFPRNT